MPNSGKYLLIGSTKAYSGKTAIALGIGHYLQVKGLKIAYGKPLGTQLGKESTQDTEVDVSFVKKMLTLPEEQLKPTLLVLDENKLHERLQGKDNKNYQKELEKYLHQGEQDVVLIEGPSTLEEGVLFDLSLLQIAEKLKGSILLVIRPVSSFIDDLLSAQHHLGKRLKGIILNDVPLEQIEELNQIIEPFLEKQGIPVMGILPRSALLRSVSVEELARCLKAEVLCRADRLNLMVESLSIGAMNVSSAMKYFRQARNMAVVTGGDRTDIQLAALESSTQCLILTGHLPPSPLVLSRAEEVEIPILSVDLDTLTTVERIDSSFGQVRLHDPIQFQYIAQFLQEHCNLERLSTTLGI